MCIRDSQRAGHTHGAAKHAVVETRAIGQASAAIEDRAGAGGRRLAIDRRIATVAARVEPEGAHAHPSTVFSLIGGKQPARAAGRVTRATEIETKGEPPVSYTHLRAHETPEHLVCRL